MTVNLVGGDEFRQRRAAGEWLWPLLPMGVSAFAMSALVSYHVRQPLGTSALQRAIIGVYEAIGFVPAFFFFLLAFSWSSIWFVTGRIERPWGRLWRLLAFTAVIATAMNLQHAPGQAPVHLGVIGGWVAGGLLSLFGYWLGALVVVPLALATFLLATDFCFYRYFERSLPAARSLRNGRPALTPSELGVEPEVADHLKSLAVVAGAAARDPGAVAAGAKPGATTVAEEGPANLRGAAAELVDEEIEPRRRRRSYYGRRSEAEPRVDESHDRPPEPRPGETGGIGGVMWAPAPVDPAEADDPVVAPADTDISKPAEEGEGVLAAGETTPSTSSASPTESREATLPGKGDLHLPPESSEQESAEVQPGEEHSAENAAHEQPVPVARRRRGTLAPIDEAPVVPSGDDTPSAPVGGREDTADVPVEAVTGPAGQPSIDGDADAVTDDDLAPAEDSLAEGFFAEEESREIDPEEIVPPSQQVEPAPPEARADEAADPDDHAETGREGDQGDERADEPEIANAAGADRGDDEQPVVLIPRSPEGVRQRRLFDSQIDEGLIEEAVGIARSSGRRVTAGYLQRKLRVDYEQAREVLQLLVQRGVIGDDEVADTERR